MGQKLGAPFFGVAGSSSNRMWPWDPQCSYRSCKTKFPDFSSQSHNISLTYIGTNFSTETPYKHNNLQHQHKLCTKAHTNVYVSALFH